MREPIHSISSETTRIVKEFIKRLKIYGDKQKASDTDAFCLSRIFEEYKKK